MKLRADQKLFPKEFSYFKRIAETLQLCDPQVKAKLKNNLDAVKQYEDLLKLHLQNSVLDLTPQDIERYSYVVQKVCPVKSSNVEVTNKPVRVFDLNQDIEQLKKDLEWIRLNLENQTAL